jgi:predicted transcriptional regulator
MQAVLRQLQEAAAVTAGIQDRHARMLVDHEEWLAGNTQALAQHREWLQQHEAAMHRLDEKLDRLADLILRGRGGNGKPE